MNNGMELIFFHHFLLQNIWDSVLSWEKMKLVSKGKNHTVLESRKAVVWEGFFTLCCCCCCLGYLFSLHEKYFQKKNIFNFLVSSLTDILSFHFLLADKWNWKDCVRCQMSFFRAQFPGSLNSLILEKCLYSVPVFSGGILCSEQTEKAKVYFFLKHNQFITSF